MKLKKPITITIETAESAVGHLRLWERFAASNMAGVKLSDIAAMIELCPKSDVAIAVQVKSQLEAQGIDWNTWLPPQPFKIAGRECEFNLDGTVKLSCGTVISNDEIAAFLKRREDATGEWPKYYKHPALGVARAKDEKTDGDRFSADSQAWTSFKDECPMVAYAKSNSFAYQPISRAEAIAIVGAENIDK